MNRTAFHACIVLAAALVSVVAFTLRLDAQRSGVFLGSADDPAIQYQTAPLSNMVDDLNRRLQDGSVSLTFDGRSGYLQSALEALHLPIDSQMLVHSQGSLQGRQIGPENPRALFFADRLALGWVRDGQFIEVAAQDERAGIIFYSLEQKPEPRPVFKREYRCLACHMTGDTGGVPGLLMFSSSPDPDGDRHMKIVATDQRSPYAERFGGWFVTGPVAAATHLGNQVPALAPRRNEAIESVAGLFPPDGYPAMTSDVAALLTFSHQVRMINLLTRASWEARAADPALHPAASVQPASAQSASVDAQLSVVAEEVVDYLLFVDEPPLATVRPDALPPTLAGNSAFAQRMSARGPRDRRGRSLFELDLSRRLMKYPCSYLIYSPAFDALPTLVKEPVYRRLWQVLSGQVADARYRELSLADRRAVAEILIDTKAGLPRYFGEVRQ